MQCSMKHTLQLYNFPTAAVFYRLPSLVNKGDCVDLSGLLQLLEMQPEREESQPE